MPESTLTVIEHALLRHKLSLLRDSRTGHTEFRGLMAEIAMLMTVEVTRDLPGEEVEFETPLEAMRGLRIREDRLVVVPILRAGLGMVEGVTRLIPGARVGHLGFYRNEETLQPARYYAKLPPDLERQSCLLVDPMLATGGTATASIAELKARGAGDIRLMCVVVAPEGARRLAADHPDVPVYTAAVDRCLNEVGYILPGLGDAGDRLFGTT